jgi:NDP-sugar pyrophosphorylase family protein
VRLDQEQRVVGFSPRGPSSAGTCHYIGVQIVDGAVFDAVASGEVASSIGGVYDAVNSAQPGSVRGFVCDASFWDVGTLSDYWRTSDAFAAKAGAAAAGAGRGARIAPSARVSHSILWDDVEVGADAVIEECILTDGVQVPAGSSYRRAVLLRRAESDEPIASPFDVGGDRP